MILHICRLCLWSLPGIFHRIFRSIVKLNMPTICFLSTLLVRYPELETCLSGRLWIWLAVCHLVWRCFWVAYGPAVSPAIEWLGWLGAAFIAFGGGARWLSTFVTAFHFGCSFQTDYPDRFRRKQRIHAGWRHYFRNGGLKGVGKLPIPFAFSNGIVQPGVFSFQGANGMMSVVIFLVLLLTCTRWKNWVAGVVTIIILSATLLGSRSRP